MVRTNFSIRDKFARTIEAEIVTVTSYGPDFSNLQICSFNKTLPISHEYGECGMMIYRNRTIKSLIYLGENTLYAYFTPYAAGTNPAGRNLYPYI